jgi:hypothetical protein
MHASPVHAVTAVASCNAQRRHTVPACSKRARVRFTQVARAVGRGHCVSVALGVQWPCFLRHCLQAAGGRRHMRDRRLAPTRRQPLTDDSRKARKTLLSSQCPLADLLAAASKKIRRKRGAGSLGTMMPSCLRLVHGGVAFFLPRVARILPSARSRPSYFSQIAAFGAFVRRFRRDPARWETISHQP